MGRKRLHIIIRNGWSADSLCSCRFDCWPVAFPAEPELFCTGLKTNGVLVSVSFSQESAVQRGLTAQRTKSSPVHTAAFIYLMSVELHSIQIASKLPQIFTRKQKKKKKRDTNKRLEKNKGNLKQYQMIRFKKCTFSVLWRLKAKSLLLLSLSFHVAVERRTCI